MKPKRKIVVLGALLLVGAGLVLFWFFRAKPSSAERRLESVSTLQQRPVVVADHLGSLKKSVELVQVHRKRSSALPSGEEWIGILFRHFFSRLPADIHVTPDELDQIVDQYVYVQCVRSAFEISIADVKIDKGVLDVVIPNYKAAGERIQSMFQERLDTILGPERGAKVWRGLQKDITNEFDIFGDSTQDMLATFQKSDGHTLVSIERTKNWSDSGRKCSTTSVYTFDAEQTKDTDYVFMAPLLRKLLDTSKN